MWTPIPPLWIESGNETHLVAIAQFNENYKCYYIEIPYVDTHSRTIAKASVTHQEPLARELERMRRGVVPGMSIKTDLPLIMAEWISLLARPSLEEALIEHLAAVSALSTDLPANTREVIEQVKLVSELLDERQVARDPLFGEICGTEYSPVELVKFQLPELASTETALPDHSHVEDFSLKLSLGSRLQNQPWRAIVYLRDPQRRLTQSHIVDFNNDSDTCFSLCFTHVAVSRDIFLVVEISAREVNHSYSRIASGYLRLPVQCAQITMYTPYKGQWSGFVQHLIESTAQSDRCPLIAAIHVSSAPSGGQTQVPSLVKDGFNSYDTLHLSVGEFHAETQASSPYYLRLKSQGHGLIDQGTSSTLLSGTNTDQCFSITNFTYGEVVKAELWRDKTLVSVASVPYDKGQFALSFNSLTTFQSIGLTKNIATLRCEATFMGSMRKLESVEVIETFFEHTDSEVLEAIRELPINQQVFEQFSSIGTALLNLMDHFNENPYIHQATFSTLIALLDYGKDYSRMMNRLLANSSLNISSRHNVLNVFLRQIFNALNSDHAVHRLVGQSKSIRDLIILLSPSQADSIHASEFSIKRVPVPVARPPALRVIHSTRNTFKILDRVRTPVMEQTAEAEENDFLWRTMPSVDQVREIVQAMGQAYKSASDETKLAMVLNLETLFEGFTKLLGESAVLLLFTLLSEVSWSTTCPQINTAKLCVLSRVPSKWKLDKNNGTLYANLCINSVAPVWVGKKDARRWIDVHATACILQSLLDTIDLTSMGNILSEFLPLTIDIASDLASLSPEGYNQEFNELFGTQLEHVTPDTIALEYMLLIHQLLQLNSSTAVSSLSVLGQSHIRQIILKAIHACEFWLSYPLLKSEWYSLRLLQLNSICITLQYISRILTSYFLPSPDANIHFDADVWYKFFVSLSQLLLADDLKVPLNPILASAHSRLVACTLDKGLLLLEKSWHGLQWKHPLSDRKSPLYGYQVSLFCCQHNVTSSFVELVFAGHKPIEPILRQIVSTEWMLNENLHDICIEVMESLDDLFIKKSKETGIIPSESQCERLIEIFDYKEIYYGDFVEAIKSYLKLLCDNYRYDTLLTVYRILNFLKQNNVRSLFTRYIGFILKTEKNPRVLGLAFMELASIYDWEDTRMVPPLVHPPFSRQRACDRKENLMVMAAQCFMNGNHWLLAIDATRECHNYYELILDYRKLSLVSSRLAQFYERMTAEKHVLPNYYYVEFQEGCVGLEGEKYIFEQPPTVRLNAFTDQIKGKYTGEIIVKTVEPLPSRDFTAQSVMPWLEESLKTNKVSQFVNSTPLPHKDVRDMRIEKVTFTTEQPLPTISGQSRVVEITKTELSPIENAVEVLKARDRELRMVCARHNDLDPEMKTSVYLELLLGSTVSSPINGGLTVYRELIGKDPGDELKQVFQKLRESTRVALDLYSKLATEAMKPQYEHFMEMFRVNFDLAMPGLQVRVDQ